MTHNPSLSLAKRLAGWLERTPRYTLSDYPPAEVPAEALSTEPTLAGAMFDVSDDQGRTYRVVIHRYA